MGKKHMAVLAAAGAGVLALAAPPAGAGSDPTPSLSWSATPTSGPAGTEVTVTGEGCSAPDHSGVAEINLGDYTAQSQGGTFLVATVAITAGGDGSWVGTLTVPQGVDPSHSFVVGGECHLVLAGQQPEHYGDYEGIPFDVTGGGTPTTAPPATPPPTGPTVPGEPTPEVPEDPEAPTPPPATPIVAPPDHTG